MSEMQRDETESELAGLADGSLEPERRAQALLRLQSTPQLGAELAEQHQALELIRRAQSVAAPASLHDAVERLVAQTRSERIASPKLMGWRDWRASGRWAARRWIPQRRPVGLAGVVAGIAAVVALALVFAPSGGGGPTLATAVTLTQRHADLSAPSESLAGGGRLTASIDGISFPYWERRFGWRATGERASVIGGRMARAVYYTSARGRHVGYAIVGGRAIPTRGGRVVWRRGVPYRLLSVGGVPTVTWQRAGHTCVLAGRHVRPATLVRLASWTEPA